MFCTYKIRVQFPKVPILFSKLFYNSSKVEHVSVKYGVIGSNPIYRDCYGEMAERLKVSVLKSDVPKGTVGSNPTFPDQIYLLPFIKENIVQMVGPWSSKSIM